MPRAASFPGTTSLLIEGWRGVHHSFAVVNQHQILELLRRDDVRVFHRDLPFAFPHWQSSASNSGLPAEEYRLIESLPEAPEIVDCVYRICSPFRPGDGLQRTLHFMITECGLSPSSFAGSAGPDAFTRDADAIITSSLWSRDRLVDFGLAPERIHIVPLGVDQRRFHPVTPAEREASRTGLGIADDETVFLNIGPPLWNKGVDLVLKAYAHLRARGRRVRLILKDQRTIYGLPLDQIIGEVGKTCPALLEEQALRGISVVTGTLDQARLRLLYGVVDAYAAPYRAEGFALPVLEAIACGVDVIVPRGGATDDYCEDDFALRIDASKRFVRNPATAVPGCFVEPDLDALVSAMEVVAAGRPARGPAGEHARQRMLTRFTWERAAADIVRLARNEPLDNEAADSPGDMTSGSNPRKHPEAALSVTQSDVLATLQLIRPRALTEMSKIRIGNMHDGGYVLPACGANCDTLLSIGIGSDVSFDLDFANRGVKVLQFDHTVDAPPVAHDNFVFRKLGWAGHGGETMRSLAEMWSEFDTLAPRRPLLKFDVEGAEYDALEGTDPELLSRFEVIVCELHGLSQLADASVHASVRRGLEKLTAHHAPVHLHANNYGGIGLVQGVPVPDVIEISLLRRDLDPLERFCHDPIPGLLDRPNHPLAPDLCLNPFS